MCKMRTIHFFVFTAALIAAGLLGKVSAWSQESMPTPLTKEGVVQRQAGMESQSLVGRSVQDAKHETIGTVEKLVFSEKGRISHIVLSTGGFLGIGEKLIKVPYGRFQVTSREVILPVKREELKAMEPYKGARS